MPLPHPAFDPGTPLPPPWGPAITSPDQIIVGDPSSGAPIVLSPGSPGQVLTLDPITGHIEWAAPGGADVDTDDDHNLPGPVTITTGSGIFEVDPDGSAVGGGWGFTTFLVTKPASGEWPIVIAPGYGAHRNRLLTLESTSALDAQGVRLTSGAAGVFLHADAGTDGLSPSADEGSFTLLARGITLIASHSSPAVEEISQQTDYSAAALYGVPPTGAWSPARSGWHLAPSTPLLLEGAAPVTGTEGTGLWGTAGAPSNAVGLNGDFAFNQTGTAGSRIYFKSAGVWVGIL